MAKLPPILVASRNAGKEREIRDLIGSQAPTDLITLNDFPEVPEVEETGATFEENARIKAQAYARATGQWTLADDSGLEVRALGGRPGIRTARFGGANATDADRIALLLDEMSHSGIPDRTARFVCAVALANPAGAVITTVTGTCEGEIAPAPRGTGGFGYDPVFIPEGFTLTFGELDASVKSRISHRARALAAMGRFLHAKFRSIA